jgi:signal transduction histidine kinase
MVWITLLLVFLVVSILFIIEKREVSTIFEESKNKGLLIAKNMADRNLQSLLLLGIEDIQENIEGRIDDKLLYVVFYDRYATPVVYTKQIADRKDILCCSNLQGNILKDSSFSQARDVYFAKKLQRILEVEIPIFPEGSGSDIKWGSVKIGLSLEDMRTEVRKTRLILIFIGLAGILLGMAGATLLARRISRPIKKLAEGTVRIAKGDFAHKIAILSQDEIGELARSFNAMSDQLQLMRERMEEAHKKLIHAEKLASIGRLSATIAHEIRNPLTSVKLNIQKVLEDKALEATEREHLALSQEGIVQIEKFVKDLLNFTRVSELQRARFAIEQILDESLKMMKDAFHEKKILIEKKLEEGLPEVVVDGDRLRQVFCNVMRNAYEAVGDDGRISLSLSLVEADPVKKIRVRISDNGCGIPEKDWENIFEPFYTTKPSGIGLGLANARKILEQHRGSIKVVKKRGKGTSFEILIPCEGES